MPAYDFKCCDCETVFEVVRPLGNSEPVECPECEGDTKRVFSPVGVVFKGSGFHNTDYRTKPVEKAADSKPCEKKDDSSSSCASCPAAKTD